ncbi:MAG: adenylate/guanylate cyclase domain-containing protein, partial [Anaerolineales bacterium]|nr:adenylate/guanylate cyclase domain-containing protein [Anaerolineales bacterium]
MSSIWQSFVPYHVAYELWQHPDGDPTEREQRFEAVLLFADVSGFTAMSEALATLGKPGAEGLTAVLNHYFEPMIALIRSYGGIVGKFGGDAMTIFFPCDDGNQREIGRRAIQCALHMQAEMSKYATIETRVGTFSLSMKMGLAIGSIFCTTVGDPRLRLEHIIAGQALDLCVAAEHLAQDGEIITHQRLVDVVG